MCFFLRISKTIEFNYEMQFASLFSFSKSESESELKSNCYVFAKIDEKMCIAQTKSIDPSNCVNPMHWMIRNDISFISKVKKKEKKPKTFLFCTFRVVQLSMLPVAAKVLLLSIRLRWSTTKNHFREIKQTKYAKSRYAFPKTFYLNPVQIQIFSEFEMRNETEAYREHCECEQNALHISFCHLRFMSYVYHIRASPCSVVSSSHALHSIDKYNAYMCFVI